MSAYTKIKIKLFLMDFIFNAIIFSAIFLIAYIQDKIFLSILFYICWIELRYAVPKIFHYKFSNKPIINLLGCMFWSIFVFFVAINNLLPLGVSLFSSVLISIAINFILYKIQDYIDIKHEIGNQTINIYSMCEEDLRNYAKSKHISEQMIDTLILRVIHNYKWVEIQQERNFTKDGIRYHKEQLNKKLNVKL